MVDCVVQDECNYVLPPALLQTKNTPLVAFDGSNDIQQLISSNMQSIRAISVELLPFAPQKVRKMSYEGIRPSGILKQRWLHKHVLEIPSVLAYILEMTDGEGNLFIDEAMQYAAELKRRERPRNVRFAILAIVRGIIPDDIDNILYSFRSKAEIDPRNFAGLVMSGPTVSRRLERAQIMLLELAHLFYEDECKRSRWVCDSLSRSSQGELLVRHNLKVAFNLEHEREKSPALKQYLVTYGELWDLVCAGGAFPYATSRHAEFKSVAELLNYKICRLFMLAGNYKDAHAQHRRHVASYRNLRGREDLLFSHYSWLSRQHFSFALLCIEHNANNATRTPLSFATGEISQVEVGEHLETAAIWFSRRKESAAAAFQSYDPAADKHSAESVGINGQAMYWGQVLQNSHRP
jgi:hypothetical protein